MTLLRPLLLSLTAGWLATALPCFAQPALPTPPPARQPAEPETSPTPPEAPATEADPDTDADTVTTDGKPGHDVVVTGSDVHIRAGEKAHDIAVNGGDVLIEGEVTGNVFVFLGKVTVLGRVTGDVVNFGRGVSVENGGFIGGEVLAVGYGVAREPEGIVQGRVFNLGLLALPLTVRQQAQLFFDECVMMARPLSIRVKFVWILWAAMLLFQGFLALLFPTATQATLRAMQERPGGTTLLGIFGLPLILLASSILTITVVASLAVPFILAALFIGLLIGRTAILRLMGGRLLQLFGVSEVPPAAEFAVGAVVTTLLFLIPVIGILAWMGFFLWSLGAILMALSRRDTAKASRQQVNGSPTLGATSDTTDASSPPPTQHETRNVASATASGGNTSDSIPDSGFQPGSAPFTHPSVAASLRWNEPRQGRGLTPDEITQAPRPDFKRRLAALLIDWIPIMAVIGMMPDHLLFVRLDDFSDKLRVVFGIAYYTLMLTWRGTTLGGLVMGLRVVRLDGRPIDRTVSLVRSLTAILSTLCFGIGWFSASWDPRRQTWHDRLAGTVVIRDDQVQPLV